MARTGGIEQSALGGARTRALDELTTPGLPMEEVGSMGMDAVELEAFMHELVTIYVHPTREKGALEVVTPSCNGTNQPIVRGVETPVKRKYVEALARAHSIEYKQRRPDPSAPDNIQMDEVKMPDYPFDLLQDTARGVAWFKRLQQSI